MNYAARDIRCAPFLVLHCTLHLPAGFSVSMRSALTPFRVRSYRFQWPADLLTSWALEMEFLILGWYVLVETGSVVLLTLFGALQHGGTLIAPILGVVSDRIGPRNLLTGMRLIYATIATTLMTLAFAGALNPVIVLVLVGLHGAGAAVRPRAARRADRRHHAERATDQRDGHVAHHHGLRAHRRRAHRRRACSRCSAWGRPTS